jgi:hypothetical protein
MAYMLYAAEGEEAQFLVIRLVCLIFDTGYSCEVIKPAGKYVIRVIALTFLG